MRRRSKSHAEKHQASHHGMPMAQIIIQGLSNAGYKLSWGLGTEAHCTFLVIFSSHNSPSMTQNWTMTRRCCCFGLALEWTQRPLTLAM